MRFAWFAVLASLACTSAVAQQTCADGRVRSPSTQGRCCWPGQTWSSQYGRCEGPPDCPTGWVSHGDDCARATSAPVETTCTSDGECPVGLVCDHRCVAPKLKAACSWIGQFNSSLVPGPAATEVAEALKLIGRRAAIANLPQAMSGNVPNAMAAIWGHTRVIVYSPQFLQQLRTAAAGNALWAVRFVLAHELGHHLEGHTVGSTPDQWQAEYQADAWASRILKRVGATENETLAAMRALPVPASQSHPGTDERVANIRAAYREGEEEQETPAPRPSPNPQPQPAPRPAPQPIPQPTPEGLPSGFIIEQCACRWAPGYRGAAPTCASRIGVALVCPNLWCGVGLPMTGVVCQ